VKFRENHKSPKKLETSVFSKRPVSFKKYFQKHFHIFTLGFFYTKFCKKKDTQKKNEVLFHRNLKTLFVKGKKISLPPTGKKKYFPDSKKIRKETLKIKSTENSPPHEPAFSPL
jgi:hypothetical protein